MNSRDQKILSTAYAISQLLQEGPLTKKFVRHTKARPITTLFRLMPDVLRADPMLALDAALSIQSVVNPQSTGGRRIAQKADMVATLAVSAMGPGEAPTKEAIKRKLSSPRFHHVT